MICTMCKVQSIAVHIIVGSFAKVQSNTKKQCIAVQCGGNCLVETSLYPAAAKCNRITANAIHLAAYHEDHVKRHHAGDEDVEQIDDDQNFGGGSDCSIR